MNDVKVLLVGLTKNTDGYDMLTVGMKRAANQPVNIIHIIVGERAKTIFEELTGGMDK